MRSVKAAPRAVLVTLFATSATSLMLALAVWLSDLAEDATASNGELVLRASDVLVMTFDLLLVFALVTSPEFRSTSRDAKSELRRLLRLPVAFRLTLPGMWALALAPLAGLGLSLALHQLEMYPIGVAFVNGVCVAAIVFGSWAADLVIAAVVPGASTDTPCPACGGMSGVQE